MSDDSKRSLRDELAVHSGKTVLLGVRSSFFFIGPAEEALEDLKLASIMVSLCGALSQRKRITKKMIDESSEEDVGQRKVLRAYVRNPDYGDDEIVIIVEGKEFGSFWTREEYLAARQALKSLLDSQTA